MSESIRVICTDCEGNPYKQPDEHYSDSIRNYESDLINLIDGWDAVKAVRVLNAKMQVYEIRTEFFGDILTFLETHYDAGHEVRVEGYKVYKVYPRREVSNAD